MVGLGLHIATGLDDWVTDDETVMLDQTCPGINLITPDLPGPRQSLSILVHNSVPDEYVQFVVLHELREGEFIHVDEMSKAEAHNEAKKITDDELANHLHYQERREEKR